VRGYRQLPTQEIINRVLSEVDDFSRGGIHEDDKVVLVLKVR